MSSFDGVFNLRTKTRKFYDRKLIHSASYVHGGNQPNLRIMQWNILAQGFISLDEFIHCPSALLNLDSRASQISEEIRRLQPDVICLQEADIHEEIVKRLNMSDDVYELQFRPKDDSPCLGVPGNSGPDGVAIIYRSDRFVLVHCEDLPLDGRSHRTALLCALKPKDPDLCRRFPLFYVVSVHLKSKISFSSLRLSQGTFLCNALVNISRRNCANDAQIPPLFLCGDFNAEPHEPVIQLIQDVACPHGWELRSVYAEVYGGSEPEFTTWKIRGDRQIPGNIDEACHTIDYIWYSSNVIKPLGVLSIPTKEEIGPHGLPSPLFPSDHMNLVADFVFDSIQRT